MTSADLGILEAAFSAEISAGLCEGAVPLIQTKSERAKCLSDDGYLKLETVTLSGRFPVRVTGYALTHKGRMAYCTSERVAESEKIE